MTDCRGTDATTRPVASVRRPGARGGPRDRANLTAGSPAAGARVGIQLEYKRPAPLLIKASAAHFVAAPLLRGSRPAHAGSPPSVRVPPPLRLSALFLPLTSLSIWRDQPTEQSTKQGRKGGRKDAEPPLRWYASPVAPPPWAAPALTARLPDSDLGPVDSGTQPR